MPLIKPKKDEDKNTFIQRCMSNDTMKDEYPDNDQRLAVCYSQWEKKEDNAMEKNIERRFSPFAELRVADDDKGKRFVGYAAVFEKLSEPMWGFREKIAPGAFADTLDEDVRALWDHESKYVLGRNKSGTLSIKEDERGLLSEITPPDTQWANDLMTSVNRGDINQMSFGFITIEETWNEEDPKNIVRTLNKVKLFDVSIVTYPAYPDTSVAVRSLEEWKQKHSLPDPMASGDAKPDLSPMCKVLNRKRRLSIKEKLINWR